MGTHLIHDITMMSPLLDVGLELDLPGGTPLPVYKLSSEAKYRQEVGFLMSLLDRH